MNTRTKVTVALDAVDASRTRTYLAYLFVVIGLTLLLPAWAGIVALAPNSALNVTGAVLAAIGIGAGIGTNALTGLNLYVATDPRLTASTGEAFIDRLWQDNAITPLYLAFLLLPVGLLLALAGLLRARAARWWELAVWATGLILLLLSSGGWIGALASIVLLAGFLLLGRRLTSRPAAAG